MNIWSVSENKLHKYHLSCTVEAFGSDVVDRWTKRDISEDDIRAADPEEVWKTWTASIHAQSAEAKASIA